MGLNHEKKYSGLKFMTPHQRQSGQTDQVMDNRKAIYDAARATNPKRWASGHQGRESARESLAKSREGL
jgi:hypothetical protein